VVLCTLHRGRLTGAQLLVKLYESGIRVLGDILLYYSLIEPLILTEAGIYILIGGIA
jgi:hypothetical protein